MKSQKTSGMKPLNQYTQRTNAGYLDIQGLALATNAVSVNGSTAYRKGEYFRKELSVANSSASVWQSVTNAASGETTVTGNIFVPKTPELYTYDADGNLTSDGHWTNRWDAENRLTRAESLSTTPLASRRKVEWQYDGQGRRIRQTTYDGSSGSYVVVEDLIFLSDPASAGRNIAELNATNNALVRSYVWGLDLSGTMDGAGGVGGLLMMTSVANGTHFYAYDGNGNVTGLVKGSDGTVSANYNYDPFGKVLRTTGAMADENRFQFSTKRNDRTTDFNLYEYRILGDGRWLSRDPIEEEGGVNLYGFVRNTPILLIDSDGKAPMSGGVGGPQIIPPSGFRYSPPSPNLNGAGGVGAYFIFGGEFSFSISTCCEKGIQYRTHVVTACGGLGISAVLGKGKIKPKLPTKPETSGNSSLKASKTCPVTTMYVKAAIDVGFYEASASVVEESHSLEVGHDIIVPPSLGGRYVICSDSVVSKVRTGCCSK